MRRNLRTAFAGAAAAAAVAGCAVTGAVAAMPAGPKATTVRVVSGRTPAARPPAGVGHAVPRRPATRRQPGDGPRSKVGHVGDGGGSAAASRPVLAVAGASFAAGVGAGNHERAFPEDLARMLGWRLVVRADPGAGYVNPGFRHRGPFARLVAELHLSRLRPAVLLIQGGHDDIGSPIALVSRRVDGLVQSVLRQTPHTKIGIVSVFVKAHPDRRVPLVAVDTNQAIVTAAKLADPAAMVFNPIADHWHFARLRGRLRLHPDAAGHREIAEKLFDGLRRQLPLRCPAHPSPRQPCRLGQTTDVTWAGRLLAKVAVPNRPQPAAAGWTVPGAAAKISADTDRSRT